MVNDMNDRELINVLIDVYANLQRIQNATDREKEIDNQIKIVKSKLESMGVTTTDLKLD